MRKAEYHGIINQNDNTCYLNSLLQVLIRLPVFMQQIFISRCCLSELFVHLFHMYNESERLDFTLQKIEMLILLNTYTANRFPLGHPGDLHELLLALLELLDANTEPVGRFADLFTFTMVTSTPVRAVVTTKVKRRRQTRLS